MAKQKQRPQRSNTSTDNATIKRRNNGQKKGAAPTPTIKHATYDKQARTAANKARRMQKEARRQARQKARSACKAATTPYPTPTKRDLQQVAQWVRKHKLQQPPVPALVMLANCWRSSIVR